MSRRTSQRARRLVRGPRALGLGTALLVLVLAGCSSGGDGGRDADAAMPGAEERNAGEEAPEEAVAGSFVGEVPGGKTFVAVVVEQATDADGPGAVTVYVSDGKTLSERYSGSGSGTSFVAKSDDGRREAKATLRDGLLAGTLELRGGKRARFEASTPSGAAGLYELTVSPRGDLSGTSAAGLGLTGRITDAKRGSGILRLVDGTRVEFDVVRNAAGALISVGSGELRVIVLSSGRVKGAGHGRAAGGGDKPIFFIRSV